MSPLRIPAFRNLWLAQAISQLGDSFYFVIFAFMVQKITGSSAMVGLVSALEWLPYLLLSAYAGVLADRVDRRRIMLSSDLASAGLLFVFAFVVVLFDSRPPVWMLIVTASSLSVSRVFFTPARGASIPALVPADVLMKANSIAATTQNMAPLVALCLSASVLAILYGISHTWFFLSAVILNMLSFAGSAIFVAKLPAVLPDRQAIHDVHPLQDLHDGIGYIKGRHELWVMLGLQLLVGLTISPFFVVYLAANKKWFGDMPQNLAWFEFSFFAGMVLASFAVGRLKIRKPGIAYILSLAGVGLCVAVMGYQPHPWLFVLWNFLAGLCIPFSSIPVNTYLQLTVPDAYRGRVNSAWSMVSIGIQPVGMALGGVLIEQVGLVTSFLTMGAGMFLSSMLGLFDRRFRRMEMPEPGGVHVEEGLELRSA